MTMASNPLEAKPAKNWGSLALWSYSISYMAVTVVDWGYSLNYVGQVIVGKQNKLEDKD